MDETNSKENDYYEVAYIIEHKINLNGSKEYFIKWKGYNKRSNSWVKEIDFSSRDIIDQYWKTI
jgi:hypothetical protein